LYSKSDETKNLVQDDSLYVSRRYFASQTEKIISKVKKEFREKHGIDEDGTLIFLAPGNDENEAEFCFDSLKRGVQEFLLKYSSPTSLSPIAAPLEKFTTVISLKEGSEAERFVRG
jgi:hypothetical protein